MTVCTKVLTVKFSLSNSYNDYGHRKLGSLRVNRKEGTKMCVAEGWG